MPICQTHTRFTGTVPLVLRPKWRVFQGYRYNYNLTVIVVTCKSFHLQLPGETSFFSPRLNLVRGGGGNRQSGHTCDLCIKIGWVGRREIQKQYFSLFFLYSLKAVAQKQGSQRKKKKEKTMWFYCCGMYTRGRCYVETIRRVIHSILWPLAISCTLLSNLVTLRLNACIGCYARFAKPPA